MKTIRSIYIVWKFCIRGPLLKYELEAKVSFYCDFNLSNYPLDSSFCELRAGGTSSNVAFKWSASTKRVPSSRIFQISDIVADVSLANVANEISTKGKIGFDIRVTRSLKPFILKYYIPCIAIVIMSQLSLLIPLDSLPGRVTLVVTQFLTLMSLFIQQMVKYNYHVVISLPIQIMIDHIFISIDLCLLCIHFRMTLLRVRILITLEYTF